jgi:hypothetical protein
LGDAVMAIENSVALLSHDHSGVSGGTSRLFQMNTHQSPDTDSSTSSLHHTVGAGATQAAAGNHSHTAFTSVNNLLVSDFGGTSRTQYPVCEVYYTGAPANITGDIWAAGGWGLAAPNIDTDSMFSVQGGYSTILVPVTGRYHIQYHTAGAANNNTTVVSRVTQGQNVGTSVVAASVSVVSGQEIQMDAIGQRILTAGTRLYWANWANGSFALRNSMFGEDSFITVRYIGNK